MSEGNSRKCSVCNQEKPREGFSRDAARPDGLRTACRECDYARIKRWCQANPEAASARRRRAHLKHKFGLTVETYDAMLSAQGGACAICGNPCSTGWRLAVDHDHGSGTLRSLLCAMCNTGLGKLKDSPRILARALRYLADHGKALTTEQLLEILHH